MKYYTAKYKKLVLYINCHVSNSYEERLENYARE